MMAKAKSICSIDGCGKNVLARGFCCAHYQRQMRHGSPTGGGPSSSGLDGRTVEGCARPSSRRGLCRMHFKRKVRTGDPCKVTQTPAGTAAKWIGDHVHHDGDECLIFPFPRGGNGYATFRHRGKSANVHRMMCELRHGQPDSPLLVAAHSCGRGHLGCVNPKHLRWATHKENVSDAVAHGSTTHGVKNYHAILTESQVQQIRHLLKTTTLYQREIAARFGVTYTAVALIKSGRNWKHLPHETR